MTREDAIKVLNMVEAHGLADEAKKMAIEALEQKKTGRWILKRNNGLCSICGYDSDESPYNAELKFRYCPNCGARMGGADK